MNEKLATYLHDHLGGAQFAIQLLERLRDTQAGQPLGKFAAELLLKIEQDRDVLQKVSESVGARSNLAKETAAWLGEKVSQLKLRLDGNSELGIFESLEMLSLGILGKRALWRALETIAAAHPELRGIDFASLAAQAEDQYSEVEKRRLAAAQAAFGMS